MAHVLQQDRPGALPRPRNAPMRWAAGAAAGIHQRIVAAEGRRLTRAVLRTLDPTAWRVAHDVACAGLPRVDHVVAGPGGSFVLESRAWDGVVTVDAKGATVTPARGPSGAWTARGEHRTLPRTTVQVAGALARAGYPGLRSPRAVVVVWAPFAEGVVETGGVTYVAGDRLLGWLTGRSRPGAAPT